MTVVLTSREEALYSRLFASLDKDGTGLLPGGACVTFFKQSKLDMATLAAIWGLADVNSAGSLDKNNFYVAMRLVALAQSGRPLTRELALIVQEPVAIAHFEGVAPLSAGTPPPSTGADIQLSQADLDRLATIFQAQQPINGKIDGARAHSFFTESKIPIDQLRDIWNLSDVDDDGELSQNEFIIAMALITAIRTGQLATVPHVLPPSLARLAGGARPSPVPQSPAVEMLDLSQQEVIKYNAIFDTADVSKRGVLGLSELGQIFSQTRLPQPLFPQILALADTHKTNTLGRDDFLVFMKLTYKALAGEPLPTSLPPRGFSATPQLATPVGVLLPKQVVVSSGDPDLDEAMQQLAAEREAFAEVQQQISIAQSKLSELKSRKSNADLTLSRQATEHSSLQQRLLQLKTQLTNDQLSVQEAGLQKEQKLAEIAALKAEVETAEKLMKQAESDHQSKQQQGHEEYMRLSSQLQDIQRQISGSKTELSSVNFQRQQVQRENNKLNQDLQNLKNPTHDPTYRSPSSAAFDTEFAGFSPAPVSQTTSASFGTSFATSFDTAFSSAPIPVSTAFDTSFSSAPKPITTSSSVAFATDFDDAFGGPTPTTSAPAHISAADFDDAFGSPSPSTAASASPSIAAPKLPPRTGGAAAGAAAAASSAASFSTNFESSFGGLSSSLTSKKSVSKGSSAPSSATGFDSDGFGGSSSASAPAKSSTLSKDSKKPVPTYDEAVSSADPMSKLKEFGFTDEKKNKKALKKANNNVQQALDILLAEKK